MRKRVGDLLLRGGEVIDGSGAPRRRGDVLVRDGEIAAVGQVAAPADCEVLDCSGAIVAPGFIDSHSHSDLQVLEGRRDKLIQGVTSEVVGNCGFSAYPAPAQMAMLRQFANGIFCGDDRWGWSESSDYLRAVEQCPSAHVGSLTGHGSLRIAVAGHTLGPLSEPQVARMEGLLDDALSAGAIGFSTGLMYAPGSSAPFEELLRLCKVVARHGKIYTSHIRSYFGGLLEAIDEQVELAKAAGCGLQISHLQAVGAANWPLHRLALERIEAARNEGVDIAFDCYPYVAGSSVLTQLMPEWSLEGGAPGMMQRLADEDCRRKIAREIEETIAWRWSDVYISAVGSAANSQCVGKSLHDLAEARGAAPVEVMLDLLQDERGDVNMLSFNQSEENLRLSLTHPLATIISDGFYVKGRPHPRLHGTFPFLLGEICRERRWMTLEEAVHKVTGAAAERFGMKGRGLVREGMTADLTVFDSKTVGSPATYEEPEKGPVGILAVVRDGRIEVNNA